MSIDNSSKRTRETSGPIDARGAFLGDFQIVGNLPADEVPAAIEGDRTIFVAPPGVFRQNIPLLLEDDGTLYSGGRYLFKTFEQARDFGRWFRDEFRLDGKPFIERPWVKDFTG